MGGSIKQKLRVTIRIEIFKNSQGGIFPEPPQNHSRLKSLWLLKKMGILKIKIRFLLNTSGNNLTRDRKGLKRIQIYINARTLMNILTRQKH